MKKYKIQAISNVGIKLALLLLTTLAISHLITNWEILMLPKSDRILQKIGMSEENIVYENFELKNNELEMTGENGRIKINFDDTYIGNFKFHYSIKSNIEMEVITYEKDSYGNFFESKSPDRLLTDINSAVLPIRNNISSIELIFHGEDLTITDLYVDNRITFNPYISLFVAAIGIILFAALLFIRKNSLNNVENIFLLIASTTGVLFIFLLPNRLGLSWDDQIHFQNVYSLSQGKTVEWTESSLHLINNVVSNNFTFFNTPEERFESNQYLDTHHNYSDIVNSQENNISWGYNKLTYLPMVLGFKIPDALGLPFTVSLLISRFANLFTYITVIYFAIRNIPICKRLIAFIALLPGPMFLAAQFSYDPPIIAFTFLATALFVKMIISKGPINVKDLVFFVFSVIIASSSKVVYIPMLLFPPLLPEEKFKDKNQKRAIFFILITILILVIFLLLIPFLSPNISLTDPRGGDTGTLRQLLLIKDHPISFLKIFFDNISKNFLYKFVGVETITHFAYVGIIPFSSNLYILSLFLLSFFSFTDTYHQDKQNHIPRKFKFAILAILVGITLSIWLALYLSFTPVGSITINGVVGRYFIPLLPLFLLLFNSHKIRTEIPEGKYNFILLLSSTIILLGSILTMILKHYCF
jgi:uncharacterized membrane protein